MAFIYRFEGQANRKYIRGCMNRMSKHSFAKSKRLPKVHTVDVTGINRSPPDRTGREYALTGGDPNYCSDAMGGSQQTLYAVASATEIARHAFEQSEGVGYSNRANELTINVRGLS